MKDFFSSSFKYSTQTTAERWPVFLALHVLDPVFSDLLPVCELQHIVRLEVKGHLLGPALQADVLVRGLDIKIPVGVSSSNCPATSVLVLKEVKSAPV